MVEELTKKDKILSKLKGEEPHEDNMRQIYTALLSDLTVQTKAAAAERTDTEEQILFDDWIDPKTPLFHIRKQIYNDKSIKLDGDINEALEKIKNEQQEESSEKSQRLQAELTEAKAELTEAKAQLKKCNSTQLESDDSSTINLQRPQRPQTAVGTRDAYINMLFDLLATVVEQSATEKQAEINNQFKNNFANNNVDTKTINNKLETIINKLESDSTISLISKIKAYNTNCDNKNKKDILDIFNIKSEYDKIEIPKSKDVPEPKDDPNFKQIILNFSEILSASKSENKSEYNNIVNTVKICYFFTILKIEKEKNRDTNLLEPKLKELEGSDDKLSILDFEVFRNYVNKNVYEYILKLKFVQEIINGLFMYLTNPFNVLVSIINFPEDQRNGKINYRQSNKNINNDLTCESNSARDCEIENETLTLPTILETNGIEKVDTASSNYDYGPFDRIFLPQKTPLKENGEIDYANENIKDSAYIASILNQFFNTNNKDKNYMIMHYGFSGTGKTTQEKKIREKIETMWKANIRPEKTETTNIFGENKKVFGIYGKMGYMNDVNKVFILESKDMKKKTKNNEYDEKKKVFTFKKIDNIVEEDIKENDIIVKKKTTLVDSGLEFLKGSELFKNTLNNDKSSRFHKCAKYINPINNSTLWYYDLAGFENPISIVRSVYSNADELALNDELNQSASLLDFFKSIYSDYNSIQLPNETTTLRFTNIKNYLNINDIEKRPEKPLVRQRIDAILESYFIMFSLNKLKETLNEYKNNYHTSSSTVKLNLFGIDEPTKFEKIVMFGFINNDKGYKDKPKDKPKDKGYKDKEMDETFLKGTIKTLEFLHKLVQNDATCQKKEPTGSTPGSTPGSTTGATTVSTTGGTIESPRHLLTEPTPFQPKQLLLESANKVTESALEPLIVGGGIIDKTVKDTDRSIVIMVTFFITFLSTYMKNTLSDKGVLKNKTEEMVTLVAFYSFFTLLFASLIELGSVDTMYMLTYLLAFGIIYITLNTYQEPKKRSLIKDRIEGEVIQEYKEMDSNLLISWMMSSIGVIFV